MKRLASRFKSLRSGDTLIRRNPLYYRRALELFDKLEDAGIQEREQWTTERLKLVLRAAQKSRYGKRVAGGGEIYSWPILEKDEIRDAPKHFLTMATWRTSHATTSGTTGIPLKLYRSLSSVSVEQAAIDRLLIKQGVDPLNYRAAVLRGDDIKDPADREPPYWIYAGGERRLVFSSNHLNRETLPEFIEEIEKFRPEVLHAYPTILDSFCNLLLTSYSRPVIPITICSSEVLLVESWKRSRMALETKMIDYYGQAERVSFAYAYEPQTYRFLPGYSYNELLPVEGEEYTYELVCTGLWNLAMPLVRLRTGDLIRVPSGKDLNAIAFGTEIFAGVIGRSGDFLIAPDGARLMGIDHIPRDVDHVVQMQIIQETPDRVRILVVPEEGFGDADRRKIESNARLKLPPPMRWEVEIVEALERNSSGKAPYVIRR